MCGYGNGRPEGRAADPDVQGAASSGNQMGGLIYRPSSLSAVPIAIHRGETETLTFARTF